MARMGAGTVRGRFLGRARVDLLPGFGPDEAARAAAGAIRAHALGTDNVVLGLPSNLVMLRRLEFPFASRAKIAQVLPFELETLLPGSMEGRRTDFLVSGRRSGSGRSACRVLAAAVDRDETARWVDAFGREGLLPLNVDLAASGLAAWAWSLAAGGMERMILADVGLDRVHLLHWDGGRPGGLRTLAWGLDDLALAVSVGANEAVDLDGARERLMRRDVTAAVREQDRAARVLEDLARETLLSSEALGLGEQGAPTLVLGGAGARLRGLDTWLGERLGVGTMVLGRAGSAPDVLVRAGAVFAGLGPGTAARVRGLAPWLSRLERGGQGPAMPSDQPLAPAGLAMNRLARSRGFELAPARDEPGFSAAGALKFARPALALILVLVLGWGLAAGTDIWLKRRRLSAMENTMRRTFASALPGTGTDFGPTQMVSILRNRVESLRARAAGGSVSPGDSAVELLRLLVISIPRGKDVTLETLTLEGGFVRLTGRTDAFSTVEEIKRRLEHTGAFNQVEIKNAKNAGEGQGVLFGLELERPA
jgi:Tfp pilus assembly PilM family ATPase